MSGKVIAKITQASKQLNITKPFIANKLCPNIKQNHTDISTGYASSIMKYIFQKPSSITFCYTTNIKASVICHTKILHKPAAYMRHAYTYFSYLYIAVTLYVVVVRGYEASLSPQRWNGETRPSLRAQTPHHHPRSERGSHSHWLQLSFARLEDRIPRFEGVEPSRFQTGAELHYPGQCSECGPPRSCHKPRRVQPS